MPRFEAEPAETAPPARRKFPKPWTFRPGEAAFRILDANGVEVVTIGFTALEMRDSFPNGKTFDEALSLARYLCRTINAQPVTIAAGQVQRGRRS